MLTTEEIKKELGAGREVELECVDSGSFVSAYNGRYKIENKGILSSDLIVTGVTGNDAVIEIRDCDYNLTANELQYFRIKRPTPTFDDLIDVAVKAARDGVLVIQQLDKDCICGVSLDGRKSFEEWESRSSDEDISKSIDFINSLYTETFVIESNHDIMKAIIDASGKLANGEDFSVSNDAYSYTNKNKLLILIGGEKMHANLPILKGATVTQKRGAL